MFVEEHCAELFHCPPEGTSLSIVLFYEVDVRFIVLNMSSTVIMVILKTAKTI